MKECELVRIAQILNKMDNGGIEAVVMNYYRNMDRSKIQFDFIFCEDSSFPQKEELVSLGAGIYPIPPYTRQWKYQRTLRKLFREHKYQVVHAHLSTMSIFPLFAAWRAKVPVRICHNHSTAEKGEGKRTILKYALRPFAKLFATHYFACGDKAARWMYGNKCVDAGKVTVLPNAIEKDKYAFDIDARAQLRGELGIPQDAFVIGHVGRFMYQKNHVRLLQIYKAAREKIDNCYLILIGEGEKYQEINRKAGEYGEHIIFTGPRNDVDKLYSVMDVFCLPSFYEGMPVVAWEAQANGLGCVFSNNISKEAQVMDNCTFVELEEDDSIWVEVILRCRRAESVGNIPDIGEYAKWLQDFYLKENRKVSLGRKGK